MLISTECPRCHTTYQVQADLRGKAMRCQVLTCQKVFLITEAVAAAAQAPAPSPAKKAEKPGHQSGAVGELIPLLPTEANDPNGFDLVPVLPAEPVEELPAEPVASDWRSGPPTRRDNPPPLKKSKSPTPAEAPAVEEAPHWSAPPPIRRDPLDPEPLPLEEVPFQEPMRQPTAPDYHDAYPRPASRWIKWLLLPLLLLVVGGLGTGGYIVYLAVMENETKLAEKADEAYQNGTFKLAAQEYDRLARRFEGREEGPRYKFRAQLSELRHQAREPQEAKGASDLLDAFAAFIRVQQQPVEKRLLGDHAGDIGDSLVQMIKTFTDQLAQQWNDNPNAVADQAALDAVTKAREVLGLAREIKASKGVKEADWGVAENSFAQLDTALERMRQLKAVYQALEKCATSPTYDSLVQAEELLAEKEPAFPGLSKRDEVRNLISAIYTNHLRAVRYEKAGAPVKVGGSSEEADPSLLFDPLLGGSPGSSRRDTPVMLALARGVLYGLDRDNGRARWAMRVGIDTTNLPVRIPARAGSRERILAVSSDTRATVTALDNDGNALWRYRMDSPCLGRPVVVEQRAFLAAVNGEVHEIELIEGKLLGKYILGQRLTQGGTHDPRAGRIYFPADDGCVFVLDIVKKSCERILYSRHPAGSLRGEPILISSEGDESPSYLILTQAAGLDAVELRVFELPLTGGESGSRSLTPEVRLDGWTWFRPHHDPEKLVMLSDAGVLGLFGIRQARNRDQALFPLLPGGGLRLDELLTQQKAGPGEQARRGRAEVVQMQGDDLWAMAANRLQRFRLAWNPDTGPRLITVWPQSLEIGSPLHAGQAYEDAFGRTGLVVVTQPPRRPATWATCVEDETGKLHWQRQLGVVCAGEPIALNAPGEAPLLLVRDQSGTLFAVDPQRYKVEDGSQWISDAKLTRLADSLDENADQPPVVLRVDESTVYVLVAPGNGKTLVVREVRAIAMKRQLDIRETKIPLPAPLAGTPAIVGSQLILPLADDTMESLGRLPLPLPAEVPEVQTGPAWRSARAPAEARGHVLALGNERFLTTDGIGQIRVWDWPAKERAWKVVPPARGDNPTIDLSDRIIAAPVLVPTKEGQPAQVAVATAAGQLVLLEVQADGGLKQVRSWNLDGMVTVGPFVDGSSLGCVIDRTKLVWIDPTSDKVAWTFETEKESAIVGQPRLACGMVVVADQSGRYVGLDPKTGKPGRDHRLKGIIAPASGAVGFHADRLLAPLSDGTLLLMNAKRLAGK